MMLLGLLLTGDATVVRQLQGRIGRQIATQGASRVGLLLLLLLALDVRPIGHVEGRRGRRHQADRVDFLLLLVQQEGEFVVGGAGPLIAQVLKSWTGNPALEFGRIPAISPADQKRMLLLLLLAVPVVVGPRLAAQSLRHQVANVVVLADPQPSTSALIVMDAGLVCW